MKKIIFIVSLLFSISSYSQVASGSFIVLNEGAEQDYLNIEELWQVYHQKSVNDGHKNHWSIWKVDVSNYDELYKIFNQISKLDILVNNAGTNRPENFSKVKTKDMNYVVDLNIKAAFNVAQLATKVMLKTKKRKALGGSIINMSSQLGKVGAPNRSVYNMTKFGIEGLTKGMAIDLAKNNIRVNSICPTFVETPLVKKFFRDKQFKKAVIDNIPLGRLATESDIATAVVYLASNASSMLTGSSLVIDGGWTAK